MRRVPQVEVQTTVKFSALEKVVIRRRQLDNYIVLNRAPDALYVARRDILGLSVPKEGYAILVRDLIGRTDRHLCDTPFHAKAYERVLRQALVQLKAFIDGNGSLGADARYRL